MKRSAAIIIASCALSFAGTASASGVADAAPRPRAPETDFRWTGQAGAVAGKGFSGPLAGVSFLARKDWFTGGAMFDVGGFFVAVRASAAATGGLAWRSADGWSAELLGLFGVHRYSGVGSAFLSDDPGADATLPFAGARARVAHTFGASSHRFQLGLSAGVEHDLLRVTRAYAYTQTPSLSLTGGSDARTVQATHGVGFSTTTVTLDLGMVFDL